MELVAVLYAAIIVSDLNSSDIAYTRVNALASQLSYSFNDMNYGRIAIMKPCNLPLDFSL